MKIDSGNGSLSILQHGDVKKLVSHVEQITFSGAQALKQNQKIIYITERGVFELTQAGVCLTEIAPGVDLQNDILDQMGFSPIISPQLSTMHENCFHISF